MATKNSRTAGKLIADNLKSKGLWKAKSCMFAGDGTTLGKHGPNEGVITCWYEPFYEYGDLSRGLEEKSNKTLLIDYKKLTAKKVLQ